ncbi:MAG: FKBP-type peptidyl-prolyl cis-trans isomerase [Verrucomicrobiae bacterium]|jgi:FKBP-type peptidyl-prolyl cis-trans isomerase|nr:FKBP-type peptidyl-prolyl cis-trans isomerase [Verrucomicrobiae bacterium]
MRRAIFKPVLLGALVIALLVVGSVTQRSLNKDRARLQLTAQLPLDNAPPALAFTTVALGGFRGLIANALWLRASELQEQEKFFELIQLADWITKLQPRFPTVWSFLSWNLAYNVSVKFPDDASRWKWVREGMVLLRDEGLRYNPGEADLYHRLAYLFQHKLADDQDNAHQFYKAAWKAEMEQLLGRDHPDWKALINPATEEERIRSRRVREEYRMDPEFMREIDRRYGPLEWRLPESHAVYWAAYGLEHTRTKRPIDLRRVVYQSLQTAVHRGRLIDYPEDGGFELAPNPALISAAHEAYLEMKGKDPDLKSNIGDAHKNFLLYAVTLLDGEARKVEAARWFQYLKEQYPEAVAEYADYRDFIQRRVVEDALQGGPDKIRRVLRALMTSHFRYLALGQGDLATLMLEKSRHVREAYERRFRQADQERVQIPSQKKLREEVLKEKLSNRPPLGFSDPMALRLCTILQIPFPASERASSTTPRLNPGTNSFAAPTREANEAFLKTNARQPDIEGTELGLQWKILKHGTGKLPRPDSIVRVHYTGRLINGSVFDTTRDSGKPAEFKLDSVVKGWREGLLQMREGGHRLLFIPARLAYGDQAHGAIPPHSTLIFDIELLEVTNGN